MKTWTKTKKTFALTICLAGISFASSQLSLASSCDGGSCGGGGNSVNHRMVEDYQVDVSDLKGSALFEAKMKELKEKVPAFAQVLEKRLKEVTFYVIPRKIAVLPESQTGLKFATEQAAFQVGKEIFISEEMMNDPRNTDSSIARLVMHELAMSLLSDRKSPGVRDLVTKIFAKKMNTDAVRTSLNKNGFGFYYSKDQEDFILQAAELSKTSHLAGWAQKIEQICKSNVEFDHLRNVAHTLLASVKNGDVVVSDSVIDPTNRPLHLSTIVGSQYSVMIGDTKSVAYSYINGAKDQLARVNHEGLASFVGGYTNFAYTDQLSARETSRQYALIEKLAQHEAFIAIRLANAYSGKKPDDVKLDIPIRSDHGAKWTKIQTDIASKTVKLSKEHPFRSHKENAKFYCENIEKLVPVLNDMASNQTAELSLIEERILASIRGEEEKLQINPPSSVASQTLKVKRAPTQSGGDLSPGSPGGDSTDAK